MEVFAAKGQEAVDITLKADLVNLNTAVAGKWLDAVLKENVLRVLPKVLWWIHEMRGHYFKQEYVKHLPFVAVASLVPSENQTPATSTVALVSPPVVEHLAASEHLAPTYFVPVWPSSVAPQRRASQTSRITCFVHRQTFSKSLPFLPLFPFLKANSSPPTASIYISLCVCEISRKMAWF
ncbi:Glycosyltransferase domain-containing protein [Forsythia ovata]|uniref:Glycosyltransferase domain-containing protein n=1 Tax=Forsythia ovata TaxID=205694 RepID=A0ABD1UXX2_9LAMI